MNNLILLRRRLNIGEAECNRVLAYAKTFGELYDSVYLDFLLTDVQISRNTIQIQNVTVEDLWNNNSNFLLHHRRLAYLCNIFSFIKKYKKGNTIFLYHPDVILLSLIVLFTKNNVFCEYTEHPSIFQKSFFSRFVEAWNIAILKRINGVFVISNSLRSYYISKGIVPSKVNISNMFVDVSRFQNLEKTSNRHYVAYCGTVSYKKDGVEDLITAFAEFHKSNPDFYLYIIGRGQTQTILSELKELARTLDILPFVVFTGRVSPDEIPSLLYNAEILALARPDNLQAQNGFPTKLGEYLATGNPVVVTNVGEIGAFLKNKENALLVSPGDPKAFGKALCWIAENPIAAKKIGEKGKELTLNEFSSIEQSKRVLQCMKKLSRG